MATNSKLPVRETFVYVFCRISLSIQEWSAQVHKYLGTHQHNLGIEPQDVIQTPHNDILLILLFSISERVVRPKLKVSKNITVPFLQPKEVTCQILHPSHTSCYVCLCCHQEMPKSHQDPPTKPYSKFTFQQYTEVC